MATVKVQFDVTKSQQKTLRHTAIDEEVKISHLINDIVFGRRPPMDDPDAEIKADTEPKPPTDSPKESPTRKRPPKADKRAAKKTPKTPPPVDDYDDDDGDLNDVLREDGGARSYDWDDDDDGDPDDLDFS